MDKNIVYRNMVKEMIGRRNKNEYSHCIICYDKTYRFYFPRFVSYYEKVQEVIKKTIELSDEERIDICEVYNYNLDIEEQLKEERCVNIVPIIKKHIEEPKLKAALDYATIMHAGQTRKDGTPYILHPKRVAENVKTYKNSRRVELLMMCAYLHDTVEDTDATLTDIQKNFGSEVSSIVYEVTNDNEKKEKEGKERYLSHKMLDMSSWALVVKLCDRLDNVSDLAFAGEMFRMKYMNETLGIFSFIIDNREFTKTHLIIMKEILSRLATLSKLFKYNDERIEMLDEKIDNLLNRHLEKEKQLIYALGVRV